MYTLSHLHVVCRNLEPMLTFWREALGAEFVASRMFGTAPGAILRYGALEIFFKELPQAEELQGGQACQVSYEHLGLSVPDLQAAVDRLVKDFGCTLVSMPAGQQVAFVRGPENLMFELLQA